MPSAPEVSVIIRARDEAASIGRCLELLGSQREVSWEAIVVDNGSHDETGALAARAGAQVIDLPRPAFSFGRALNLGAQAARGEVLVALSAHAFVLDEGWLARIARALQDEAVACASGDRCGPDGEPLRGPLRQDLALARRHPEWGYSNAAGGFPAGLWRQRPFREDLPGCEDREWAWHWLGRGRVAVIDPALAVEHDHTHDPVAQIFRRARREAEGLAMFGAMAPTGVGGLGRAWWSDTRWYDSPLRARLSHRRAARLLGSWVGRRRGSRS